ncbi:IS66 family transposase [Gimesia maris]|nr:IS66 family transposase [Gimesia maris]
MPRCDNQGIPSLSERTWRLCVCHGWWIMNRKKPEVMEVDHKRLQDVADRARQSLAHQDAELIERVFESYEYVAGLIQEKNMSIGRLQKMLFGAKTEKTRQVVGNSDQADAEPNSGKSSEHTGDTGETESDKKRNGKPPPRGHGRNGADAYRGAEQIEIPHSLLHAGDPCLECGKGTLYQKLPRTVVRITGQAPLGARTYALERLRCGLCGAVFTAALPREAGREKYDARAGAMIGLLKYGSGLPFNRLQGLQGNLEIPLPASTQWDVVSTFAPLLNPAFEDLMREAAQGTILYNDDTTVKILTLMGERRIPFVDNPDRTGLFTSGVISTRDGRRIALFFSSHRHAGENLAEVLKQRAAELESPIQMCDALARNIPRELGTIVANCLAHARRQFVEIHDLFPAECGHVLEALKIVYKNDATARKEGLSSEARLELHQAHSQLAMTELKSWLHRQFDERLVEPNSTLGTAVNYLLRHWEKLTLFLHKAGAPLDNNVCERALKKAICHRKNSLFYRTQNGARIGDMFMSLIHTCELNQANPFDYLTELFRHPGEVAAHPERFLPWNYRQTIAELPAVA